MTTILTTKEYDINVMEKNFHKIKSAVTSPNYMSFTRNKK